MKSLFAALRFLTILPVPESWSGGEKELSGSIKFFPLAGLLIGVIVAGFAWCVIQICPAPVSAVLIVISLIVITGGLHLDGLADTADGFLSVKERRRTLEIMKDSRSGAMGVIAIVVVLLLKVAAVVSVPKSQLLATVLLMSVAGRCVMVIPMSFLSYARSEGGLGSLFNKDRKMLNIILSVAVLMATGWLAGGLQGITACIIAIVAAIIFTLYSYHKIGGFTGDTLGATCELVEMTIPLTICIWSTIL